MPRISAATRRAAPPRPPTRRPFQATSDAALAQQRRRVLEQDVERARAPARSRRRRLPSPAAQASARPRDDLDVREARVASTASSRKAAFLPTLSTSVDLAPPGSAIARTRPGNPAPEPRSAIRPAVRIGLDPQARERVGDVAARRRRRGSRTAVSEWGLAWTSRSSSASCAGALGGSPYASARAVSRAEHRRVVVRRHALDTSGSAGRRGRRA